MATPTPREQAARFGCVGEACGRTRTAGRSRVGPPRPRDRRAPPAAQERGEAVDGWGSRRPREAPPPPPPFGMYCAPGHCSICEMPEQRQLTPTRARMYVHILPNAAARWRVEGERRAASAARGCVPFRSQPAAHRRRQPPRCVPPAHVALAAPPPPTSNLSASHPCTAPSTADPPPPPAPTTAGTTLRASHATTFSRLSWCPPVLPTPARDGLHPHRVGPRGRPTTAVAAVAAASAAAGGDDAPPRGGTGRPQ